MLRAEKLCQSVSMSGPSAMANPIAPKIAAISSDVRLIGWISPRDLGRGGRVGVDPLGREFALECRGFQIRAPCLQRRRQRFLQPVHRCPALPARLGRDLPKVLQQRRDRPIAPKQRNAHRIPGAKIRSRGKGGLSLGPQGRQVVHGGQPRAA